MRDSMTRSLGAGVAFVLLATLAAAGGKLRLPADKPLPQSPDSPGVVVFSHASHVDESRPDCSVCHPRPFGILKPAAGRSDQPKIRHEDMEAGRSCGVCHNDESAHGLEDCAACHHEG